MCQVPRRSSPSVTHLKPHLLLALDHVAMASSSMRRSSPAEICLFSNLPSRVEHGRRPKKTAHVVGAKRGFAAWSHEVHLIRIAACRSCGTVPSILTRFGQVCPTRFRQGAHARTTCTCCPKTLGQTLAARPLIRRTTDVRRYLEASRGRICRVGKRKRVGLDDPSHRRRGGGLQLAAGLRRPAARDSSRATA